jgi:predicted alpha/beta-hydrolase family hydrolase
MNSRDNSSISGFETAPGTFQCRENGLTPCFSRTISPSAMLGIGLLLCLLLAAFPGQAVGQESGKELEAGLRDGQAVWLDDGKGKFFSVFNPDQSGQPKGGVILLHDAGSHPDKQQVMRPLRHWLPLHGWATIAIQLPPIERPADYLKHQATIEKRINSAISYIRNKGFDNLVLLGHGSGAMAASKYLSGESSPFLHAFVAISLGIPPGQKSENSIINQLEKINLPILDIYGGDDLDNVVQTAQKRALAAKISGNIATRADRLAGYKRSAIAKSSTQKSQGYIAYRQIRIDGASHDFSGAENLLSQRIVGWLERHAKGVAVNR